MSPSELLKEALDTISQPRAGRAVGAETAKSNSPSPDAYGEAVTAISPR